MHSVARREKEAPMMLCQVRMKAMKELRCKVARKESGIEVEESEIATAADTRQRGSLDSSELTDVCIALPFRR